MTISRRRAREWAVQMLCAADLNPPMEVGAFIADFWEQIPSLGNDDGGFGDYSEDQLKPREVERLTTMKEFAESLVRGTLRDLDDIDGAIRPLLDHWDLYRLGTVERSVLRLGFFEIREGKAPAGVIINEAVDLVNWFSAPGSRMLINGVLDKYAKSR